MINVDKVCECPIFQAVKLLGSYDATGRVCLKNGKPISGKAVMKWVAAGRLPRTEATGETTYAKQLSAAHDGIDKAALLATVMRAAT